MSVTYGRCGACGTDKQFGLKHGCSRARLGEAERYLAERIPSGHVSWVLSVEDTLIVYANLHDPDPVDTPRVEYLAWGLQIARRWNEGVETGELTGERVSLDLVREAMQTHRTTYAEGRAIDAQGGIRFTLELVERFQELMAELPRDLRWAIFHLP